MLTVVAVFALANVLFYLERTLPCCDWTYATGIPFAFLEEGGFSGIRHIRRGGMMGDIAVIFVVVSIADRIIRKRS